MQYCAALFSRCLLACLDSISVLDRVCLATERSEAEVDLPAHEERGLVALVVAARIEEFADDVREDLEAVQLLSS